MPPNIGKRAATVREISLDDELTLFDTESGTALALNGTARAIWERADGVTPLDVVVGELAEHYHVPAEAIRDDVLTALRALTEAGVLVPPT